MTSRLYCNVQYVCTIHRRDIGGMDSTEFVLFPCKPLPGLLVVLPDGTLGMTDFESIGYVPKSWVTTRLKLVLKIWGSHVNEWRAENAQWGVPETGRWDFRESNKKSRHILLQTSLVAVFEHIVEKLQQRDDYIDVVDNFLTWKVAQWIKRINTILAQIHLEQENRNDG